MPEPERPPAPEPVAAATALARIVTASTSTPGPETISIFFGSSPGWCTLATILPVESMTVHRNLMVVYFSAVYTATSPMERVPTAVENFFAISIVPMSLPLASVTTPLHVHRLCEARSGAVPPGFRASRFWEGPGTWDWASVGGARSCPRP